MERMRRWHDPWTLAGETRRAAALVSIVMSVSLGACGTRVREFVVEPAATSGPPPRAALPPRTSPLWGSDPARMIWHGAPVPLGDRQGPDSDGDGLLDDEEAVFGTAPKDEDTDRDGLLDGWEVHGAFGVKLRAMGADPMHKDVFVEMDYMVRPGATNGLGPSPDVIAVIERALRAVPIQNPDRKPGIEPHLVLDDEIAHERDLSPHRAAFGAIQERHFEPRLAPIFHYMVWADRHNGGRPSGVSLGIPGSAFIVTLGSWNDGNGGTDDQKTGTFLHELGHNLGLDHGGEDTLNYKPNYLSIMNHAWQMTGVCRSGAGPGADPVCGSFIYQPIDLPALDETSLDETLGIGAPAGSKWVTRYFCNKQWTPAPTRGPIDWACDGPSSSIAVGADVNGDGHMTKLGSRADVGWMIFDGGAIGKGLKFSLSGEDKKGDARASPELTEEEFRKLWPAKR